MRPLMQPALTEPPLSLTRQVPSALGAPGTAITRPAGRPEPVGGPPTAAPRTRPPPRDQGPTGPPHPVRGPDPATTPGTETCLMTVRDKEGSAIQRPGHLGYFQPYPCSWRRSPWSGAACRGGLRSPRGHPPPGPRRPHPPASRLAAAFPAVTLLADDGSGSHVANTGSGMANSNHFRAGSVPKSFIATVAPQLADERRPSLPDSVDEHRPPPPGSVDGPPPGLARGAGDDGHRVTPRSPPHHTGGLRDFTRTARGAAPVTPPQVLRIALTRPPSAVAVTLTRTPMLEHPLRIARRGRRTGPGARTRPARRPIPSPHPVERPGPGPGSRLTTPVRVMWAGDGGQNCTMSGAPSRAASAVRSSGWRWDSRSASTRFS
ncbi:serine hydrolase [Streptomyces triticiradicis]|uniref:Serine hydrolase n=1 Tax=Streptomyces triticiradicis TaxID=2651189 RepID=A0A7J5DJ20_9ACTN|nr:serine hydrolase [Streptomyces triticiradicis]